MHKQKSNSVRSKNLIDMHKIIVIFKSLINIVQKKQQVVIGHMKKPIIESREGKDAKDWWKFTDWLPSLFCWPCHDHAMYKWMALMIELISVENP